VSHPPHARHRALGDAQRNIGAITLGERCSAFLFPELRRLQLRQRTSQSFPSATPVKMCNQALGAHEISKLICGPPVIDYGVICAAAKTRKIFAVTNNLQKPVHVRLNVEHMKDVEAEQPDGMVVPPGCHAAFGVLLCVPRVTAKYRELVTYSINNGAHTFAFELHAEVVPVNLKLDKETIIFRFTESNWEPFVEEVLVLTNTNTYPADFRFEIPGPAFQCIPEKGQVDAKSSLNAIVKWVPSKLPNGNECSISLHVEGATTHKTLRCVGEAPEGKLAFKEKAVDLKEVAVGCVTNRFLTLKNVGPSDGFFNFDLPHTGDYTLRVEPARGRLMPGASLEVEMEFEATVVGVFDLSLTANVRGGKPVKLPLHAEAIVPSVTLDVDEFDLGTVYLGGDRVIATTLTNESGIMAELELDLRQFGAFSLVLPQDNWSTQVYNDRPAAPELPIAHWCTHAHNGFRKASFRSQRRILSKSWEKVTSPKEL
jgi:hypothetical protein